MYGNYQLVVGQRVDTGKKWTASTGQAFVIYRKVVDLGALPNNTTKSVAHTENPDIEKFTKVEIFAKDSDSSRSLFRDLDVDIDVTNIIMVTGTNLSGYTQAYAVIEFCDTTDEGS